MIFSTSLDKLIGQKLLKENAEKQAKRTPSGKLSASSLGDPLQWQVLKWLGVPQKEVDEYTLRKFLRGNQIEDWFVSQIDGVKEKQKFVEYRGVVGYVDAVVDTEKWDTPKGLIPLEIKSVTNMKFKRILKEKQPQRGHKFQAGFYAMAEKKNWFAISYVASDDLRIETMVMPTAEVASEVELAITLFNRATESKVIPVFEPIEKWQANKIYSRYPDWQDLAKEELEERSKELFARRTNQCQ